MKKANIPFSEDNLAELMAFASERLVKIAVKSLHLPDLDYEDPDISDELKSAHMNISILTLFLAILQNEDLYREVQKLYISKRKKKRGFGYYAT